MSWKDWPYWLKVSIILGLIIFISVWSWLILDLSLGEGNYRCPGPMMNEEKCSLFELITSGWAWFPIVSYTLIGIILGAIIGLIYGKIKSKTSK